MSPVGLLLFSFLLLISLLYVSVFFLQYFYISFPAELLAYPSSYWHWLFKDLIFCHSSFSVHHWIILLKFKLTCILYLWKSFRNDKQSCLYKKEIFKIMQIHPLCFSEFQQTDTNSQQIRNWWINCPYCINHHASQESDWWLFMLHSDFWAGRVFFYQVYCFVTVIEQYHEIFRPRRHQT